MRVPLLDVDDLTLEFQTRDGVVRALDAVSFRVHPGEVVGLVGESGSGKSVTAFAVIGLMHAAARVRQGRVVYGGMDMLAASETERREVRGREIAMIFQNPRAALNPIRKVGHQIADVLRRHGPVARSDLEGRAIEALRRVRIPDPERRYHAYPFELSGGLCQRVLIAMALSCRPALLIADEPTTGLDVTTQASIMDTVTELCRADGMATVLITHDLGLAAEHCDRIVVMHAGHVVEDAPAGTLFDRPRHPYTGELIAATPTATTDLAHLAAIPGSLPDLRGDLPPCRYAGRCARKTSECDAVPLARRIDRGHAVACWNPL